MESYNSYFYDPRLEMLFCKLTSEVIDAEKAAIKQFAWEDEIEW